MGRDCARTRFIGPLCELTSGVWIQGKPAQTHSLPSVKLRLGGEAAKTCSKADGVKRQQEKRLFVVFHAAGKCGKEKTRRRKRVGRVGKKMWGGEGDRSTKTGCRASDTALSSARRTASSSDFDNKNETGADEAYSSEIVPTPGKGMTTYRRGEKTSLQNGASM